jgi:chromate transporter
VSGVTASATGAIAGAAYVLGRRAVVDLTTAAIALVVFVAMTRTKKVPEPIWIALAAGVGILARRIPG